MDKEEFRIKLEEINHLVEEQDYKGAMNVVDSIDWRRVKNVRTLCVVGEIYAANKRYEESREIFLLAYHRAPIGKNILYRLIEVSLKLKDIEEAMEYYEEFKTVAPNDNTRYVLKYKIFKTKKASLNEQIAILEEYKAKEFTERWSYELAKLYYRAGEKEKCQDLCNEIILWFNEGSYVIKALDLKMRMGVLTGVEKEKYEQQFVPKLLTPDDVKALAETEEGKEEEQPVPAPAEEKDGPVIESIQIRNDKDLEGTETLQEKITKGIRDIFGAKKNEEDDISDEEDMEAEILQEEMIKKTSFKEELKNVPELEKEGEKPDFSKTMKLPELDIPDSMKNIKLAAAPEVKPVPVQEEAVSEKVFDEEKADFDFNLEETILAAASAQGIEIPEEKQEKEPVVVSEPEPEFETASKPAVKKSAKPSRIADMTMDDLEDDELEEEFTEEDLQKAEAEFLNGPVKTPAKLEIPDLEPEDMLGKQDEPEVSAEDDDFIANILRNSMKEEENLPENKLSEMIDAEEEEEEDEPLEELSDEEELERFIDSINPQEEVNPLDIIPRERELRDEERKLFTYFVKVPGMKEQLINTLCDVQLAAADKTSKTGNIVVMGGRETGKTRLISGLIPAVCKELNLEASRVAYVFAEQINGRDMAKIINKLSGGFFVIENANQLDQNTAEQLDKLMETDTRGLTIILEDEKIGMRKMLARYPKLAKKFTSVINIPVFTNDELANFAKVYAKENGYRIDNMGMLALYNLIGINQKEDEPMNIGVVKQLIDAAIAKSSGGRLFKKNSSKKRLDRDGYIVLYEKDFSGK